MSLLKDLINRSTNAGDEMKRMQKAYQELLAEQKLAQRKQSIEQTGRSGLSARMNELSLRQKDQKVKLKTKQFANEAKKLQAKQMKALDQAVVDMSNAAPQADVQASLPEEPIAQPVNLEPGQQAPAPQNPIAAQLAKFVDPDAEPSSGQPDMPTAAVSPAAQEPASPPASPSPTTAQDVPPQSLQERLNDPKQREMALAEISRKTGVEPGAVTAGVKSGLQKTVHGLSQAAVQGLTKLGVVDQKTYDQFTQNLSDAQKKKINTYFKRNPDASRNLFKTGQVLGEIVPWLAVPVGGAAGAVKTASKLGVLGAAAGGAQFVEPGQRLGRGFNIAAGGVLGAATGAVTGVLSRMAQGFTKKGAKLTLAKGLAQAKADKMGGKSALQAGRRLGIDVPMAEATQHPSLITKASAIRSLGDKTKTSLTSKVIKTERKLAQRATSMIDDVLGKDSRQAVQGKVNKMMDSIANRSIPKAKMKELLKNPTITNNLDKVLKNPNLQGIQNRMSFRMMDTVKQQLRSQANGLVKAGKAGAESGSLFKAANQIDNVLKGSSKRYSQAMQLAQRYKVYDKWKGKLQSITQKAGKDKPTLKETYTKMFDDDKVFNELLTDLKAVGMKTQPAKDLRLVLNRLSNSPMGKLMGRQTDLVTGMSIDQGPGGVAMRSLHAIFKRRYNNEIVRLMTSGKWDKELANIAKIKSTPRMIDRLAKLLTVVGAKGPGMATRKSDAKRPAGSEPIPGGPGGSRDGGDNGVGKSGRPSRR